MIIPAALSYVRDLQGGGILVLTIGAGLQLTGGRGGPKTWGGVQKRGGGSNIAA